MRSWKWFVPLLLLVLLAVYCLVSARESLSMYLPEKSLAHGLIYEKDLQEVRLQPSPVISSDDIVSYNCYAGEMKLTPLAYDKIMNLGWHAQLIYCLGKERVGIGTFWSIHDSMVPPPGLNLIGKPDIFPTNTDESKWDKWEKKEKTLRDQKIFFIKLKWPILLTLLKAGKLRFQ